MKILPEVTVIIATTAEKKRKVQLSKAIDSILTQQNCSFNLIVIINGRRYDENIRNELETNSNLSCYYLEEGHYPKALVHGRKKVDTPYFCFLDDDDELLPNSLHARLAEFVQNPDVDAVIGNGVWQRTDKNKSETHNSILEFQKNPLAVLLQPHGNWLCSCAGMFKSATIPQSYFDDYAPYGEWTYIAYKLAVYNTIHFVEHKCFRINVNSESLSHDQAYLFGLYEMHKKVLSLSLPSYARKKIILKKKDMEHVIASQYLANNEMKQAWYYHFKSMTCLSSLLKYVLFTRHLVLK